MYRLETRVFFVGGTFPKRLDFVKHLLADPENPLLVRHLKKVKR